MIRHPRRCGNAIAAAIAAREVGSIGQHAPHVAEGVVARTDEGIIRRSLDLPGGNVPVTVLRMPRVGKRLERTVVDGAALDVMRDGQEG
jgi:hypothetical protein